jgi:hypothetical protein
MIDENDRLSKIDECEQLAASTFHIYKPTWDLIIKALTWSIGKTAIEINNRIVVCQAKRDQARYQIMKNNWQLIIETLRWVFEETDIDPIESRKALIPFAG